MLYEGREQFICNVGHLYEVTADVILYGIEDGVDYQKATSCPECGGYPVWQNSVNDTNRNSVGLIPKDELDKWLKDPTNKLYRIPTDEETRNARHCWDVTSKRLVPMIVLEVMLR